MNEIDEIANLIAVGFVESLPSTGEPAAGIRHMLGPRLTHEFDLLNW